MVFHWSRTTCRPDKLHVWGSSELEHISAYSLADTLTPRRLFKACTTGLKMMLICIEYCNERSEILIIDQTKIAQVFEKTMIIDQTKILQVI